MNHFANLEMECHLLKENIMSVIMLYIGSVNVIYPNFYNGN